MSDDLNLNDVFDIISGWSVEEIQNLMYHMNWSRAGGIAPFKGPENTSNPDTKKEEFDNYRVPIKSLFDTDADNEVKAKWVICATFLFMDDDEARKRISEIFDDDVVQYAVELLKQMDATVSEGGREISKLQLFYTLHKQRESLEANDDGSIKTKKVTWSDVTSPCGPKIVQSDEEHYHYVYEDMEDFDGFQERYNIAAKLGEQHQYRSDFLKYENDEVYGVQIIKVLATKDCSTFDQVVINEDLNLLKENEKELEKVMETIAKEYFRQVDYNFDRIPEMSRGEFEHVLPRLKGIDDDCYEKTMAKWSKWQPLRTKVTYGNVDYHVVHGDEWPGNFLTSKDRQSAYFMDFEDALLAEVGKDNVQSVGGDLASRIVSEKKTNDPDFTPAALNIFGSIGRLIAAIVQFGSIQGRVGAKNIGTFLNLTLDEFEEALKKKNPALVEDYWEQYQTQILLHAWDWALYWMKKDRFRNPHAERFIDEIKKLLCGEESQTDEQKPITYPSRPDQISTDPRAMPSDNTEVREEREIRNEIIENADVVAWNSYREGDFAKAEANWGIALQMLNEMKSNEDKGYFSYFKTKVAYLRNGDIDQAVESLLQCVGFCQDDNDDASLMEALRFLAYLRRISGTRSQARDVLNQVVYLYNNGDFEENPEPFDIEQLMEWPESDDYSHTVLCLIKRSVANFFWTFGEHEKASRLFEDLMQYYEGTRQHSQSDNARMILGILKSKLGEYEESDELQNQCLEYRRKEYAKVNDGDTGEITKALRNLGQNAMAWRKFEKAKQYFTKCIDELRKVPSEVIHRDNIAKFIGFNEHCVMVCDINIQIMSVQNHYLKRQDKIKRLRAISEESDLHLEVCLPSLMRLVDRGDRCYTKENLSAFLKFSNHNIMIIANLLIDRFEEYEYARELLLSIHSNDLDYLTTKHLCQMLEKIYYFYDDANRENLANYHAELEDEFSIAYPSFLDPSQEVVEKVEMRDTPFWQLDKYMTKLLIDLGVVDFHIHEGLHDSTFREILTDLFHSHDSKSILRLIHMGLAGQLWPYEDYTSGSDLLKARDTYSSDVMENVDVMWENAQSTLDDLTEYLTVIVSAMSNIKVASIASNSKMKYYMSRFSDATKVMEAWFSKDDDIKSIYNTLCKFVTKKNSVPKQLQFLCNIIDDISDIDVPAMQQRLFAIYAIIWSKSNARYTISLKKPGFHTHKDSVIKLAERLCIWIKQQPQTFELIASFSSDSKSLEGDSRIFMAKQLVELYESRIPQKWPFDVLQTRPKEMEGQQTKTIRNTEFKQEIEIAELERQSGSWSKSIERLKLVVDASKEAREYLFCADALNDLGTCYFEQERFDKAKEYYEEAMDLYCQIEDKEGEVDSLMNLALIANERKRFLDAEAKFDKCLDIYTALGQEVGVADVHINRADIRIEQEHYPEARENIQIALGILKTLNDKKWYLRWATALNVSADLYRKLDCFDEAINELEQAKSLSEEITDIKGLSDLYNNFGIAHMQYAKLLSLDGTPEAIKQFKKAEKYFRIHLETIAEIEERPNKWFEDNGFYTDSKIWPQFPPNDSPNWK